MGNDDAAADDNCSSPSVDPTQRRGWYVVDIGRPTQANAVPSIASASTPEREKAAPTIGEMEAEKTLKPAIKTEPSSPANARQEQRAGGTGGGGLPLPVSAARWGRRQRAGSMPRAAGPASNAGSTRMVRTSSPARPGVRDQIWQQWRGFVRQVQNAGSGSTPSGSLTGTANASNSTHLAGRADGIANEVIRRDMAEKQQAAKLRRPRRRAGTGQGGAAVGTGAASTSFTRRVAGRFGGGPSRAKSATEATGSVRFRSVDGETDRDIDDDDDDDRPRVAPKQHEMLVLDQGFSNSDGWTRRFAHLGPSGFHPSAPSEEFIAEGAPHNGSATYSATGGHGPGDYDEEAGHANLAGCWGGSKFGTWLRWRLWPRLYGFYDMPFLSAKEEAAYRKEQWFSEKRTSLLGSAFYIIFGVLTCSFAPRPYDHIIIPGFFAFGIGFAAFLPFTIIYNWPRKLPFLYQIYLWIATWSWALVLVGDIQLCGYFRQPNTCGKKDFSGVMYAAVSLPSVAMLGLGMHRFAHVLGSLAFVILMSIFAAPHSNNWKRNVLNFIFFTIAVQTVHWAKEKAERRVWTLRDQLKKQFRATQKAQVAEAKASNSKKRFTSYVFHEIRVPLNTALLALQNLQNAEVFGSGKLATTPSAVSALNGADADDSEVEWHALLGSLVMMRKVLDDVLDYSRMDAGRFETVVAPFFFHRSLRSLVHSLNTAARSKGLDFVVELDPSVDEILLESAKAAARDAGEDDSNIYEGPSMGDEMRLRQIVTNLCSNATKFTPAGGRVTLRTRLLFPSRPSTEPAPASEITAAPTLAIPAPAAGGQKLLQHHLQCQDQPGSVNTVVVRIEVEDTGVGISPQDLHDLRLFSPYVQTTLGRMQGGKGTGLGLALVRSIVRMSKGRLGVISTKGKGSQFWVELPLGCGKAAHDAQSLPASTPEATSHPSSRVVLTQRPTDTERMLTKAEAALEKGKTLHEQIGGEGADLKPIDTPGTPDDGMGRFQLPIFTMNGSQPSTTSGATRNSFMTPPAAPAAPAVTRPSFARSDKSEQSLASIRSKESRGRTTPLASPPLASPGLAPPQWKPAGSKVPSPAPPSPAPPSPASASSGPPASTTPAARPQASPAAPTMATLRILLVDDDTLTRRLMSRMLTRQGHICTEAADGHEALVKLGAGVVEDDEEEPPKAEVEAAEHRFDLIMLDNFMPGRHSGVDVIRWMRRLGRRDLTVGCTANAEKGDQTEFLEAGLDDILTKPISQVGLMRICNIADARRRQRSAPSS